MSARSLGRTWGSTPAERRSRFPCDNHLSRPDDSYHRAIDVHAPAGVVFRWLCQLRVAPYSYDWIDNLGRRSPRKLVPGLENLSIGQRFMQIFDLVEFEQGQHLTLLTRPPARLGQVAVTYRVDPTADERCRLVVKLALRYRGARSTLRVVGGVLPWLELIMMRKQLLTLKELAEHELGTGGHR